MIKKVIRFTNFNDEEVEQTVMFNLSEQDVLDILIEFPDGFEIIVDNWEKTGDFSEMFRLFKAVIQKAYGVKSEDGMYFRKTDQLSADFMQSAAYEELFRLLRNDDDLAIEFFNNLIRIPAAVPSNNVKRS